MNINNWSTKQKILTLAAILALIIGLVVTIFLVQQQQDLRGRAEKSTTISLEPPSQISVPGDIASLDVVVNPGVNLVALVKFKLLFDENSFSIDENSFILDPSKELEIVEGPIIENGSFAITVSIGNNPLNVITSTTKIGTLNLRVLDSVIGGSHVVSFDENQTLIRSISGGDTFSENVLSSTSPATITILQACTPNVGVCDWDPVDGAISYSYIVTEVDEDEIILEGETSDLFIEFPSVPGKTYKCSVTATNNCGETGDFGEGESTCPIPTVTPTPTISPTPTLTLTPSPSPTGIPSSTPTLTLTPTPTTVTQTTNTPTPTLAEGVTPTSVPQGGITSTPTPTIVPPGSSTVLFGSAIAGFLLLVGGIVFFLL